MTSQPASVMLVDDHPLLRKGLQQLISLSDNLEVVAEEGGSRGMDDQPRKSQVNHGPL